MFAVRIKRYEKTSSGNEEDMRNELNEMEKQLHRAILQSEQLEKRLFSMVDEKSALVEKITAESAQKSHVIFYLLNSNILAINMVKSL